jgi:hypothetical protein
MRRNETNIKSGLGSLPGNHPHKPRPEGALPPLALGPHLAEAAMGSGPGPTPRGMIRIRRGQGRQAASLGPRAAPEGIHGP